MFDRNARHKERMLTEPAYREKHLTNCKATYRRNPTRQIHSSRRSELQRLYGLTEMDYELGVMACGGRCEICGQKPTDSLCVDHIRDTKMVRGLLCRACNLGLGTFKDSPERLRKAAEYLERE